MIVLSPLSKVIITKHADRRLQERFGIGDLDAIRTEIMAAVAAGRYEHRARNIFYVHTDQRIYPVVLVDRGRLLIVMTAMGSTVEAAAA